MFFYLPMKALMLQDNALFLETRWPWEALNIVTPVSTWREYSEGGVLSGGAGAEYDAACARPVVFKDREVDAPRLREITGFSVNEADD